MGIHTKQILKLDPVFRRQPLSVFEQQILSFLKVPAPCAREPFLLLHADTFNGISDLSYIMVFIDDDLRLREKFFHQLSISAGHVHHNKSEQ